MFVNLWPRVVNFGELDKREFVEVLPWDPAVTGTDRRRVELPVDGRPHRNEVLRNRSWIVAKGLGIVSCPAMPGTLTA